MSAIIEELSQILDGPGLLLGEDSRNRQIGWGRSGPCLALAVVRPRTTAEVSEVMRLCHAAGVAVVPQGGLTGLVGGTVPSAGEIALSLERMKEIEVIDAVGRTMTVQAGVPLQTIQQAAEDAGLLFPLDLGARGSCTIGGNVASNAGGNRTVRYGMTRDMVLGLEAVLADGTVVSAMNQMIKNNAGYDIKHLFIGSEGTLGIVTRVVLRLRQKPRTHCAALAAIADFNRLTQFLSRVDDGLGGQLSAFEVMWTEFYELVTSPPAHSKPPLPHGHPFYVLVESLGSDPKRDGERFEEVLGGCLEDGLLEDAVVATSRAERDGLWEMRDDIEQLSRIGPNLTFDVSLPIATMDGYVQGVKRSLKERWPEGTCVVFGHLGDGNLHLVVGVGSADRETRKIVEDIVYGGLESLHGSVSAEHGIGTEKRQSLGRSRSPAEIAVMKAIKQSLDPENRLNPGKVLQID